MNKYKFIALCAISFNLTSCAWLPESGSKSDFDVNSNKYTEAQPTNTLAVPDHIANNIKTQPLYPIDTDAKLNGELHANKVPPTLAGTISEDD